MTMSFPTNSGSNYSLDVIYSQGNLSWNSSQVDINSLPEFLTKDQSSITFNDLLSNANSITLDSYKA